MARRAPADRCYVILFSARSGSSWLGSVLSGTKRLGFPREYMNPNMIRNVAQSLDVNRSEDFIAMLLRAKQSRNGIFGLKARAIDIELFGKEVFLEALAKKAIFFHLWRDNLVAQGISLYRAVSTRRFHSTSTSSNDDPPPYNAHSIMEWIRHVAATENDNVSFLNTYGIPARHLIYESIVESRAGTLRKFAEVMGTPLPPASLLETGDAELTRVGDAWNSNVEAQIRLDHSEEISAIDSSRLVKYGVSKVRSDAIPKELSLREAWRKGRTRAEIGRGPQMNPFLESLEEHKAWHSGWRRGWDDQRYL